MQAPGTLVFRPSPRMTLGVELELQVLDCLSRDLTPRAPQLVELLAAHDRIKPELLQSMLEVCTGVCDSTPDVRRDLDASLTRLRAAGRELGLMFSMAGSHPFAVWSERLVSAGERYRSLIDRNRWLARRLMIFGLHIHVGMRDGEHAVAMLNGLLHYLPHVLALSASSPFWEGTDTGLASSRITLFEALPTAGHPCTFGTWQEFQALYGAMFRSRAVSSIKDFWWDIRLHPDLGTVELRICDGASTLSECMAIVALVHCLYARLDEEFQSGRVVAPPPDWIVRENKWRASRWGLDAEIVLDPHGRTVMLRDEVARLLPTLEPAAARLDCAAELRVVGRMLDREPSYQRQRAALVHSGRIEGVVDAMAQEFDFDRPWESPAPSP
jgi:carboxylate-amine ligase